MFSIEIANDAYHSRKMTTVPTYTTDLVALTLQNAKTTSTTYNILTPINSSSLLEDVRCDRTAFKAPQTLSFSFTHTTSRPIVVFLNKSAFEELKQHLDIRACIQAIVTNTDGTSSSTDDHDQLVLTSHLLRRACNILASKIVHIRLPVKEVKNQSLITTATDTEGTVSERSIHRIYVEINYNVSSSSPDCYYPKNFRDQHLPRTLKWMRAGTPFQNSSQPPGIVNEGSSDDPPPSISEPSSLPPFSSSSSRGHSILLTTTIHPAISPGTTSTSEDVTTSGTTEPTQANTQTVTACGLTSSVVSSFMMSTSTTSASLSSTSSIMALGSSSESFSLNTETGGESISKTAFSAVLTAPGGVPSISTTIIVTEVKSSPALSFPLSTTTVDLQPTTFFTSTTSDIANNGSTAYPNIASTSLNGVSSTTSIADSSSSALPPSPNTNSGHGKHLEIGLPLMFLVAMPLCITAIFFLYRKLCPEHYASTEKYCPIRRTTNYLRKVLGKMKVTRLRNRAIRARSESDKTVESFREWMLQRKQWEKDNAKSTEDEKEKGISHKRRTSGVTTRTSMEEQNSITDPRLSTFEPSSPSWPLPSPTSIATWSGSNSPAGTGSKLQKARPSIETTVSSVDAEAKYHATLTKLQHERALRVQKLRRRREQEEVHANMRISGDRDVIASITKHEESGDSNSDSSYDRLEKWWRELDSAGNDSQTATESANAHQFNGNHAL